MKNYIQYLYDGGKYTPEQIKEQQRFLKENYGYNGAIDGLWTMKDRSKKSRTQIAAEKAEADGYSIDENGRFVKTEPTNQQQINFGYIFEPMSGIAAVISPSTFSNDPMKPAQPNGFGTFPLTTRVLDNVYPYGYGERIREKLINGIKGKSPQREALDEFVELDLSDPEQRKRGQELANKYFTNFSNTSLDGIQASMRARLDLNDLYIGREQKYGTWMVNPDYESPTAKAAGVPTITYRDPKLRAAQQRAAANYGQNHGVGVHKVQGDELTTFGSTYTINTMNPDGSGRYMDEWDFALDNFNTPLGRLEIPHNRVIVGDTIYSNSGNGGRTYIRPASGESVPSLNSVIETIIDQAKREISNSVQNAATQVRPIVSSVFSKGKKAVRKGKQNLKRAYNYFFN